MMEEKKNPIVTFEMEDGKVFKAELYPEIAPISVENFISLREAARLATAQAVRVIQSRVSLPQMA